MTKLLICAIMIMTIMFADCATTIYNSNIGATCGDICGNPRSYSEDKASCGCYDDPIKRMRGY